jgi:hypothetical protein
MKARYISVRLDILKERLQLFDSDDQQSHHLEILRASSGMIR